MTNHNAQGYTRNAQGYTRKAHYTHEHATPEGDHAYTYKTSTNARGRPKGAQMFSTQDILDIRELALLGEALTDIALAYGVTMTSIFYIVTRKTYKDVQ